MGTPDLNALAATVGRRNPDPPPTGGLERVTARSVPTTERLDGSRNRFQAPRAERFQAADGGDFHGAIRQGFSAHGVTFFEVGVDPTVCRLGQPASGVVVLGCICDGGVLDLRCGRNPVVSLCARSGILLFDCDRPVATISSRCVLECLAMPRALAAGVLGADPVPAGVAVRVMPRNALAGSLRRLLRDLGIRGANLSARDVDLALAEARALAIALLAGLNPHWRSLPDACDEDLLTAVHCQLRRNIGDPGFTGTRLAANLGCSRAHLYRLFERIGETISGQLRELRLQHARVLLQTRPEESVGTIALACGYTGLCAFGKAFRRRFGLSPRDWRERARLRRAPTTAGAGTRDPVLAPCDGEQRGRLAAPSTATISVPQKNSRPETNGLPVAGVAGAWCRSLEPAHPFRTEPAP